jgi:hypothetical protein
LRRTPSSTRLTAPDRDRDSLLGPEVALVTSNPLDGTTRHQSLANDGNMRLPGADQVNYGSGVVIDTEVREANGH